jgi:hypothetical protein
MFSLTTLRVTADVLGVAIACFLAWRVTRGGAVSRVLLILYTGGWIATVPWSPGMRSGGLVSLAELASALVQLAVLVSTPIYERTRKNWAEQAPSAGPLWPTPPRWMAAAALAAGVLVTLLFLGSMSWKSVPCAAGSSARTAACSTLDEGFPVHFLSALPAGADVAYPAIDSGAAAEDLTVWSVLGFAACYLIWLPARRPSAPVAAPVTASV